MQPYRPVWGEPNRGQDEGLADSDADSDADADGDSDGLAPELGVPLPWDRLLRLTARPTRSLPCSISRAHLTELPDCCASSAAMNLAWAWASRTLICSEIVPVGSLPPLPPLPSPEPSPPWSPLSSLPLIGPVSSA